MGTDLLEKYGGDVPRYTSYPTAPHFHLGIGDAAYRRWLEALPAAQPLSLYVHVPFCDSLCWFCGCHTKIVRRYEPVAGYLEVLRREVDLAAETLGAGRPLAQLHFGGGSPTIMVPADVEALMAALRRGFGFTPETEFAVEVDPRDAVRENIAAWTKATAENNASTPSSPYWLNRW